MTRARSTDMLRCYINGRWEIQLPEHRTRFHEQRPWWEAARLADMYRWIKELNPVDVETTDPKKWLKSLSREVILDVGSEEGDFTALYASWGAEVHYIDPSAPWISQTRDIFLANDLEPGVGICALADNRTDLDAPEVDEKRFVTIDENVPRITLDKAADWWTGLPDAVVMDVEGSEMRVLEGAHNLLTHGAVWWISIHGDVDPHAETPSPIHWFMRTYGYQDQWLGHQHEWFYRFWK